MLAVIGIVILLIIVVGPSMWAQTVLQKHSKERSDYPGTGGEFARHILDLADLQSVKVETTQEGDHYDPTDKVVRLSEENFNGRTLTGVVVAAHEVGHALQDRDGYGPLKLRTGFAKIAWVGDMAARGIVYLTPFVGFMSPRFMLLTIGAVIAIMAFRVLLHVITLPVEFDASFNRALPVLDKGRYLPDSDMPAARNILTACAMTYVAAALFSIIDIVRWFRFGR